MLALPRLIARLRLDHPKYKELENQLYRIEAGYAGEQKVDRFLESIDFPNPVTIFTDVQLPITPKFSIQIDTLIITPSYAFILEIKNIAGTLAYITNPPHFECTYPDKKTIVLDCPVMQLNNNKSGLDIWFKNKGFDFKTTGMIVLATNTLVKNAPPEMPIIYAKHLPLYFRKLKARKPVLNPQQYSDLVNKLNKSQERYIPYPLTQKYQIEKEFINKGVLCEQCHCKLRRSNHVMWTCPTCKTENKKPYIKGIQDWIMLIQPTISNEECRDYFRLQDKFAANYILNSTTLKRKGNSKSTVYTWDYSISPTKIQNQRKSSSQV